jgi:alkylation response protein AidB-like acyl-CoA dehydrogenase
VLQQSDPLQAIETLLPQVAARAENIEQQRKLPQELVDALKTAGAFRLLIPQACHGLDVPFERFIELIQQLARADASTAWCVNQAAVIGTTSLWLPASKIDEIWSPPDTSVANGPPFDCHIQPHRQGYELTGHWGFSSGCQHATWMMGAARYSEGGWRIAYFRPEQVTFTDNWQVAGLRGTGSFEFRVDKLVLPADQVADAGQAPTVDCAVTRVPSALLFAVSFAGVALGVAEGALDDVLQIVQGKLPRYASLHLRDDPDVQRFIGKATARWRAAHAYLYSTVGDVMQAVRANDSISHDERSRLRMAGTHVIRECADVLDLAYKVAGSTGIYQDHTLQRRFQDMHVITQHVQAREAYFGLLGRYAISGQYETGPMT